MLVNKLLKKSAGIFWGALLAAVIVGCGENDAVKYNTTNSVINEAAEKNVSVHEKSSDVEDSSIDIKGAKLVTEGKLTVGMVIDYPPFEYYPQNSSQPIGIDVDIAEHTTSYSLPMFVNSSSFHGTSLISRVSPSCFATASEISTSIPIG